MKNHTQFPAITAIALLLTLSGCASSGSSTENTSSTTGATVDGARINTDTLQVVDSEVSPIDTVTTAVGDTASAPVELGAATTISGSTESISLNRPDANTIIVNGDASERLDNYLRRVAGVQIAGEGPAATIRIRGITTLNRGTSYTRDPFGFVVKPLGADAGWRSSANVDKPLFIVDGIRMGRFFEEVYHRVNMSEVKDIKVLKGPEAAIYGSDGAAGVIIINYFSASDPRQ